jgi:hypothetical protein
MRDAGVAQEQRGLFSGHSDHLPMTTRQFGRLFKDAAKAAGLRKTLSLHSLAIPSFLRDPSARARQRYSSDPGVARNGDILPTNNQLKLVSPIGSIRALAKWSRSDGGLNGEASSS